MLSAAFEYYVARGFGYFLIVFIFLVGMYLLWSTGVKFLANHLFEKSETVALRTKGQCKAIAIGLLLFSAASALSMFMSVVIMRPHVDEEVISRNNNFLMQLDHRIFGMYPPLWLQQEDNTLKPLIDKTVPLFIHVYLLLTFVMNLTLLMLFFFRTRLCIQLISAFFLCAFFSMPFWYYFPSFSPMIAYWEPILFQDIPANVAAALRTYSPVPPLEAILQSSVDYRGSIKENSLIVTTIPSMHIAWGFLTMYYLISFSRIFAVVGIPFFVLNSISTVITMQHYAIDIVGGILVAVLAIVVAGYLSRRVFHIFDPIVLLVQDDVNIARKWIREYIR